MEVLELFAPFGAEGFSVDRFFSLAAPFCHARSSCGATGTHLIQPLQYLNAASRKLQYGFAGNAGNAQAMMLEVGFEMLGKLGNITPQGMSEIAVIEGCKFGLPFEDLAPIERPPLSVSAQTSIRDFDVNVEMRLLVAIREMKIGCRHHLPSMAFHALSAEAISEIPLPFCVLHCATGGFHNRLLKENLLLARQRRVYQ